MIKAAFFDIDGTLYDWNAHRFVPSGIEAVKALSRKGIKIFLCSSRPYDSMRCFGVFDLGIPWNGWVGSAGGIAYCAGKFVFKETVDPETAKKFVRTMKAWGLMYEVIGLKTRYFNATPNAYFENYAKVFTEPWCPVHPYRPAETSGFLLFCPQEFDDRLNAEFPDLHFYRFHETGIDVTCRPRSKGRGIQAILNHYGFSRDEAIGFGDDIADISMQDGVGHLVCLGQGKQELKEVAEFVTSSIDQDGILRACLHYGLL